MRYPDDHKSTVRARIVEAAAQELRRAGVGGVSIPALMRKVGLTHGGFYAHFRDRDELVAEAVTHAAQQTGEGVFARAPDLDAALELYLSSGHVEHPEAGCVIASLGPEGTRQSGPLRRAFAEAARGLLQHVEARRSPGRATREPSDAALALAAGMVGAVVLARLVDDPALAARILRAVRVKSRD